jgi:hypothetical protein
MCIEERTAVRTVQSGRESISKVVAVQGVEVEEAIKGDPGSLLDGERVISCFKFDVGTLSPFLRVHLALEVQSIRVALQAVREPAEPWSLRPLVPAVENLSVESEVFL